MSRQHLGHHYPVVIQRSDSILESLGGPRCAFLTSFQERPPAAILTLPSGSISDQHLGYTLTQSLALCFCPSHSPPLVYWLQTQQEAQAFPYLGALGNYLHLAE